MMFEDQQGMTADGDPRPRRVERADHRGRAGQEEHLRLHVRAGEREQPGEPVDVAQRQDRVLRRRQHRHPGGADRAGRVPRVRARAVGDDERNQSGRQPLQRSRRPVRQLLQRRRRPARLPPRVLRLPAEPRLCRDAVLRGRRGLSLHADRDARQTSRSVRRRTSRAGTAGRAANTVRRCRRSPKCPPGRRRSRRSTRT